MSTVVPPPSSTTSSKTTSDPAYTSTNLGAAANARNNHDASSSSRARPGLRGDDHSVVGGSGSHGVAGFDSAGCRQHDIPKHDKQSHPSRKKTPIRSWRHKLNVCRYPSIESIDSVAGDLRPSNFRRSSSDHGTLAEVCAISAAPRNNSMNGAFGGIDTAAINSNDAPTTNKRTTRNSPFCPCFSPTDSDLDEDEPVTVASSGSNRTTMEQHAPSRASSSRGGIINRARDWRSRVAVNGDQSNNQTAGPVDVRRPGDGITMSDPPYPVHTTVEYTHFLVPDMLQITNAPYYWGVMDRFEAERLLDGKPEGTFLLRDSAQSDYMFSVSFRRYQRTLHARIEVMNHRFSFDSYDTAVFSAPTVTQLIENYKDPSRCLFFEPQLTHPLHRTFVFPLQHLCRAALTSRLQQRCGYDDVNKLLAPAQLKKYLREYHYKEPLRVTNNETTAEQS